MYFGANFLFDQNWKNRRLAQKNYATVHFECNWFWQFETLCYEVMTIQWNSLKASWNEYSDTEPFGFDMKTQS